MGSHEEQLRNPRYRDWVKAGLALKYLKEGIEEFVDDEIRQQQRNILEDVRKEIGRPDATCDQCPVNLLLPDHKKANCVHGNRCICRYDPHHRRRQCPNNVCGRIFDKLVMQHMHGRPSLGNTDSTKWCSHHWEIAKCFLDGGGYEEKDTAANTDCKGLLSVITNNMFVQRHIDTPIDKDEPRNDVFSKSKEARNEILHLASLELSTERLHEYIDVMLRVLGDKGKLQAWNHSKQAACKLKQLKETNLVISTEDMLQVRSSALQAIKEKSTEALDEIDRKQKEITEMIQTDDHQIKQLTEKLDKLAISSTQATQSLSSCQDSLENRQTLIEGMVTQLKNAQSETAEKLKELLKDFTTVKVTFKCMEKAERAHEEELDYLKRKQAFQEHLKMLYQRHYTTTSISPLKTEDNSINIRDVYVSPKLVVEERNHASKQISGYHDIFKSNDHKNRKIFVVGGVGTGKSSFCKMMIYNWCRAIERDERVLEGDCGEIDEMRKFNFLFYIPLRNVSGVSEDLKEMVKLQFPMFKSVIDELFDRDSERCLILADGLDEWTPPTKQIRPMGHRIPSSFAVQNATVVTTSRPSAQGILRLKGTDSDTKINLLGIPSTSVELMVEQYMRKLGKEEAISNFMRKLRESDLGELEKRPLLLQQIIWMYCCGHEIGKTQSIIYCSILNIMFGWLEEKGETLTLTESRDKRLRLPNHVDKYPRCRANQDTIFVLGKIAFETFLPDDSSITFGRAKMQQCGLSEENISILLRLGILTEERCPDPSYESTQFSFVHTSFLEFFVTLYIASHCDDTERQSANARVKIDMIEKLVKQNRSTTYILELRSILTMVCGLDPNILEQLSSFVYDVVSADEYMTTYRRNQLSTMYPNDLRKILQIQNLIHHCITESGSDEHLQIKISDFFMTYMTSLTFDKNYSAEDVLLLYISTTMLSKETLHIVKNLHHSVKINDCSLSHKECTDLTEALSGAVYLKELALMDIKCNETTCCGHLIDLSKQQLRNLVLWKCHILKVSSLNITRLESCEVSHYECADVIQLQLAEAMHLRELVLQDINCKPTCNNSVINMWNNESLQLLVLRGCKHLSVSSEHFSKLVFLEISNCSYTFAQYEALIVLQTQAVNIRRLRLRNIRCGIEVSDDYELDLSNNKELRELVLCGCKKLLVSKVSPIKLESCEIVDCLYSQKSCMTLTSSLTCSVLLRTLVLCDIAACYKDGDHIIDLSNHKQLEKLLFINCRHLMVSNFNCLKMKSCDIRNCLYSHHQFAEMTLSLSHTVHLNQLQLRNINCSEQTCQGHLLKLSNYTQLRQLDLWQNNVLCVSSVKFLELLRLQLNRRSDGEYCLRLKNGVISHDFRTDKQATKVNLPFTTDIRLRDLLLDGITCNEISCEGHNLDTSNKDQLQRIDMQMCKWFSISKNDFHELESFSARDCSFSGVQCASLAVSLSNAINLKELSLSDNTCRNDTNEGCEIDLSSHDQLQRIVLRRCRGLSVCRLHILESVEINDCTFSHSQYTEFALSLTHAVYVRELKLVEICCRKCPCEGHKVDLSDHQQQKKLLLQNCDNLNIFAVKTFPLETCNLFGLSHQQCGSLSELLTQTLALKELTVDNTGSKFNDLITSPLHKLQTLKLMCVQLDESDLIFSQDMKNLTYVVLKSVKLNSNTWLRFIDNLLILTQSVKVETDNLSFTESHYSNIARHSIRSDKRFHVVQDKNELFSFEKKDVS